MHDICNPDHFFIYEFPPPDMKDGCTAFIMDWEEVIEKEMQARTGNDEIENKICNQISKACKNVDVKNAPRADSHIMVDGQPVPVSNDGKVTLPPNAKDIEL